MNHDFSSQDLRDGETIISMKSLSVILFAISILFSTAHGQNERQLYDTMLRVETKIDVMTDKINNATSRLSSLETWRDQNERYYGDAIKGLKEDGQRNSHDIDELKQIVSSMRGMVYATIVIGGILSFLINLGVSMYSMQKTRAAVSEEIHGRRKRG